MLLVLRGAGCPIQSRSVRLSGVEMRLSIPRFRSTQNIRKKSGGQGAFTDFHL